MRVGTEFSIRVDGLFQELPNSVGNCLTKSTGLIPTFQWRVKLEIEEVLRKRVFVHPNTNLDNAHV